MIKTLRPIIEAHPFFAGLDAAHLELITGCARNLHYGAGSHLMREGDAADTFFLIRKGRVSLQLHGGQHGPLTILSAGPGDVIGWAWLIPPYMCQFDAIATSATKAIQIDGKCLRGKCERNPALGYALLQRVSSTLAQQLTAARVQLLDVYGETRSAPEQSRDDIDEREGDLYGNFF